MSEKSRVLWGLALHSWFYKRRPVRFFSQLQKAQGWGSLSAGDAEAWASPPPYFVSASYLFLASSSMPSTDCFSASVFQDVLLRAAAISRSTQATK